MQFLKTLFWVILAVVAVVFAFNNWTVVALSLWGGMVVEAKLPVLLLLAFLTGLLPTWLVLQARRWRLRRRLDAAERALAELRGAAVDPAAGGAMATPPPAPVPIPAPPVPG